MKECNKMYSNGSSVFCLHCLFVVAFVLFLGGGGGGGS